MAPKCDYRRLGFYYYPDTLHYRESDLCKWLPTLQDLGASWITLVTPVKRAIPETFPERFNQCRNQTSLTCPCPYSSIRFERNPSLPGYLCVLGRTVYLFF